MTLKEKFLPFVDWNDLQEDYVNRDWAIRNAERCEKIADEFAIEFALFLSKECETNGDKDGWWFYNKTWKTTNELLEIFKKEKGL